jgi:hypothetical protein
MACPKCGCKTTYQYDPGDDLEQTDERLERCAACRHVFDIEDSADEDEECPECHGEGTDKWSDHVLPCPACCATNGVKGTDHG